MSIGMPSVHAAKAGLASKVLRAITSFMRSLRG